MANTYYIKLSEMSEKDAKVLTGAGVKPADKVMVLLSGDARISADRLLALNGISASIEFVKLESEADLYFYLGMNYQSNGKSVFLSGINVPESILKTVNAGTKKRAVGKGKTATASRKNKKDDNLEIKDANENVDEAEIAVQMQDESNENGIAWMHEGSARYFADNCGLPEDIEDREEILEFAAKAFSDHFKVSEAIDEIMNRYGSEIAEYFKKTASVTILAFDKAALKQVDV